MQINPVIEKELKTKMRGWKAPALVTGYIGFLGLITILYFVSTMQSSMYSYNYFNPRVAVEAFNILVIFQFALILLVTPALTGASISGERERQTLDLLLCTNLSTYSIISGKIFVSIAHVMLLITASLPVLSAVFLFGGIGILDLLKIFAFYIVVALMVASLGILYSTVFKRSVVAIIMTYVTLGVFSFGTPIFMVIWYGLIMNGSMQVTYSQLMVFMFSNPGFAFLSVMEGMMTGGGIMDLFGLYRSALGNHVIHFKPWMINGIFNIIASAVFILLAGWKIKPVK